MKDCGRVMRCPPVTDKPEHQEMNESPTITAGFAFVTPAEPVFLHKTGGSHA